MGLGEWIGVGIGAVIALGWIVGEALGYEPIADFESGLRAIAAAAAATHAAASVDAQGRPAPKGSLNAATRIDQPRPTLIALLVAPSPTPTAVRRPAVPRRAQTSASP